MSYSSYHSSPAYTLSHFLNILTDDRPDFYFHLLQLPFFPSDDIPYGQDAFHVVVMTIGGELELRMTWNCPCGHWYAPFLQRPWFDCTGLATRIDFHAYGREGDFLLKYVVPVMVVRHASRRQQLRNGDLDFAGLDFESYFHASCFCSRDRSPFLTLRSPVTVVPT